MAIGNQQTFLGQTFRRTMWYVPSASGLGWHRAWTELHNPPVVACCRSVEYAHALIETGQRWIPDENKVIRQQSSQES
jgi:hypothetical protein